MATIKRLSHSTPQNDTVSANPSKPKKLKSNDMKYQNSEEEEVEELGFMDTAKPSSSFSSILSMEKRKKRKAFDKERRKANKNADDFDPLSNPEHEQLQQKESNLVSRLKLDEVSVLGSSSSNGLELAKFHIDVFNELASADDLKREVAVGRMMEELIEVQKEFESNGSGKDEGDDGGLKLEAQKDDGLNGCAQSVRYAVRRLIRGVSSSRECARQGFALGLTMVVATIPAIKLDALLKLIVDLLEVSSSMKGQEMRECLLGRLFAYGALARSRRLAEEWNSDHSTPIIKEFTNAVISLAAKKTYLRESGVAIVLDLVEKLPTEAVLTHVLEAPGLQEWFKEATDVGNPDALLLALKIQEKIHVDSTIFGNLLPHPFSAMKLFSSDHLTSLVKCFKNSSFCQPRVHSVWPVLVNVLLPEIIFQAEDITSASNSFKKHKKSRKSNSSEEETLKNLRCFCEAIEESLLLSSHDRKYLALDIMLFILQKLPASFLPILLSYKLVQCLMDVLSTKDSWLHKVAQNFLKELSTWVGNDDLRRVSLIVALQKHSNGKFDSVTRTRTVKELMARFKTESGCMLFIQNLINMFVDEGNASEDPSDQSQTTDDNSEICLNEDKDLVSTNGNSDSLKIWIVESLPSILKYLKLDPESKFRVQKEILKFLTVQGLFSASLGSEVTSFELEEKFKWPKLAASSTICGICIEQIQLLLVGAQKMEGSRTLANGSESIDLGYFFMRFFTTLRNIPSVSLFRTLSDEDKEAFEKLQELETKLSREEKGCGVGADLNKLHAMRYLLMQLLLQVLQRPGEFSDAVSELIICCKKAFAASIQLDSSAEDGLDSDGNPELMDVLVDTLLSLLPQSSVPMRSAIEQVFKYFCENVTDDGLLRMLRVIKKDLKPPRHRGGSDSEDEDDDEDFLGIEEDEVDEAETGETAESEEQMDDSEAVAEVEQASKEPDYSDDSDGGMDDDAMFQMDSYMAQIFKEKKNQAGNETAQSQLVLFKLRVLSLLEIYLHENQGKPQVLTVCSNLTQALVNPQTTESSEQLAQRIWGILQKKVFKTKEFPKGETVELSSLESLLEKNLKLASKPFKKKKSAGHPSKKKQSASWKRYKMIVSLAQDSTYWVLKIVDAKNFSETELRKVVEIFKGVLEGYFESKKSQIKADFLKEIFRRRPWIGQHLFGFLVEKCGSSKSEFRQVVALELVMEIFKSMVPSNPNESNQNAKKMLKNHVQKIGHLINVLVTNMPEKQSRRADVRKFCCKFFHTVSNDDELRKSLLKNLSPEAQSVCESQYGELFLNLKMAN